MITFVIDELTECLKDSITGEKLETEVIELKRKSLLSKFNSKTAGMSIGELFRKVFGFLLWF